MKSLEKGGLKGKRGELTINLQWNTIDDLDLIVTDPGNNKICFTNKEGIYLGHKGILDVDANARVLFLGELSKTPQENIYWETAAIGDYKIEVSCYKKRVKEHLQFTVNVLSKLKLRTVRLSYPI